MLLGMFSAGAANTGSANLRVCGRDRCSTGGRVGWVEVREHEEVFFVTFVVSLVSIRALRKGKGEHR